ncbi:probable serine hydrolase [Daphnia pulicaria]|uniref:probable serine hydrolase n=1 Tax=Daphnia pulicaria TaxID=35523 RepID=UPI001EEA4752|nr:probable serine hydrolase [Daphnia pulicaria]
MVIDFFRWEKVTLMGHSMGGQIATFVASIFSDKILKLISLDALKLRSSDPDNFSNEMKSVLTDFQSMAKKLEQIPRTSSITTYNQAREKLIRNYSGSVEAKHADFLLARSLRKKGDDEYEYTRDLRTIIRPFLFNDFTTEKLREIARGILCPFLLIRARNSITSVSSEPVQLHQEFIEIYRNASKDFQLIEMDGKHHIHLTHPELVAPYICDFLNKNI